MEKRQCLDQLGRTVTFDFPPQRIISLVPSQTELLFELGLADRVVGITRFCVHPAAPCSQKQKIGGTKKFDFKAIARLNPNLVLGNKEENYADGIGTLAEKFPVWMSDINNLDGALHMIREVGDLTGSGVKAKFLAAEIQQRFKNQEAFSRRRVIYFIWNDPYMAAGQNTFIDAMLSKAGFENCVKAERYPALSLEDIAALSPQAILLSSEPFPFRPKHAVALARALPNVEIIFVDGEMFSWYGSRLLQAPGYFVSLRQRKES